MTKCPKCVGGRIVTAGDNGPIVELCTHCEGTGRVKKESE